MRAVNQALAELKKEKRQLFVTRSPVLVRHVESNFRGLIDSTNIANKTPEELAEIAQSAENRPPQALVEFDSEVDLRKDLPSRYSLLRESHFPLFISFEKVFRRLGLLILITEMDASLAQLCSLIEADLLRYEKLKQLWKEQDDIMAAEEVLELEEQGKIVLVRTENPFRDLLLRRQDSRLIRLMEQRRYIGYSDFKERYWPQFRRSYKPEITPPLVYSEIMGVIKGSSHSIHGSRKYLSKDQYLSGMVRRVSAQLDMETREHIYAIFEQYKKLLGAYFEMDMADRAHCLLEFVNDINAVEAANSDSHSYLNHDSRSDYNSDGDPEEIGEQENPGTGDQEDTGWNGTVDSNPTKPTNDYEAGKPTRESYEKLVREMAAWYQKQVGYLYVDEVQDNLMVDIQLLSKLCTSVENTYWGGDTAQTIVAGSAFRIKELGAHLYKYNEPETQQHYLRPYPPISQFQLTVNFRSHNGIVQCAASIVQKLYELFPNSLDKMEPETGRSSGSLPVIFTDSSSDIFLFEQFLLKSSPSSNMMFGAQQAILVRSEAVAEELHSTLSELCPIITIADSKGLEFEDILVYNFFSTSELPLDAWDFVHGRPMKAHRSRRELSPPPSLCSDLKLLYVALTRARKRCWIWDHGYVLDAMKVTCFLLMIGASIDPKGLEGYLTSFKQIFWHSQSLITTASISEMTGWNTVASTPAQWIEKGREYFANANYKLARGCFLRGGDQSQASIAEAYHLMTRAKLEAARDIAIAESNKLNLVAAAEKLKDCAKALDDQNARNLWFHAGTCLELARKINEASEAYVHAELYEQAISLLLGKERYARAVSILLDHQDKLDPDICENMLDQCRVHYIQASDYDSLRRLFKDTEALLAFTTNRGYQSQYITFLEHNQRYYQLAQVYLKQKLPLKALDYLLREFNFREQLHTLNEAAQLVVAQAEWALALDSERSRGDISLEEMIRMIEPFSSKLVNKRRKEILVTRAILNNSLSLQMADEWKPEKLNDQVWVARILHLVLKDTTWMSGRLEPDITRHLASYFEYLSILAPVIEATEPSRLASAQRLLGFKPANTGSLIFSKMIVADWSIVVEVARRHKVPLQWNQYGELLISSTWVDRIIKAELTRLLKKQLLDVYIGLKRFGWTSPARFTPRPAITNSLRYVTQAVTSERKFASRIRVTTTAIQAFSPTRRILCRVSSTTSSLLYRWLRRLFDALYPSNGMMEESDLILSQIDSPVVKSLQACVQELVQPSSIPIAMNTSSSALIGTPDISTFIIGCSLSLHLPLGSSLLLTDGVSEVVKNLGTFFNWSAVDGLTKGTSALRSVLKWESGPLDAVAIVHFVEMITCDMLYHYRKASSYTKDGFSGLILPFSWARSLAKRYDGPGSERDTDCLDDLLSLINTLSNQLKDQENQRWFIARESLSDRVDMAHIINLRLCWCIALLIVNSREDSRLGLVETAVEVLLACAQDWRQHKPEPVFCRYGITVLE
ncbi:hypothetical protein OPQ81_002509 [Rhizoctonia solani]|nr:hypothetical protein OPQ81_002509 [Rhizoctonia solani]